MLLSCVILICDKDYIYVSDLIKEINNKVKINHEIIIIDNREEFKNEIINLDNAKIYSKGFNLCQIEGRKFSLECVNGDYVWFIDADDEVKEVPEQEHNTDIVAFNFTSYNGFSPKLNNYGIYNADIFTEQTFNSLQPQLWNKWFKTDLLKQVYSLINYSAKISSMEDFITSAIILKYAKSLEIIDGDYYTFHTDRGYSMRNSFDNTEQFKTYIQGHNLAYSILVENLTEEERNKLGLQNAYNDFMASHICKFIKSCEEVQKEILPILLEVYDAHIILQQIPKLYPDVISLIEMSKSCVIIENKCKELGIECNDIEQNRTVSFILHKACNKKCLYCNQDNTTKVYTDDEVFNNFSSALSAMENLTNKHIFPQVLGGEPSLWSNYLQNKIIERLKDYKNYRVFTNGTNLDSPICKNSKALVSIHITEWHNKKLDIPANNIDYNIVVPANEISYLENFLKLNTDIERLTITPCVSDNSLFSCKQKEAAEIKELLIKYNRFITFENPADCKKDLKIWQIDCNETNLKVHPCCRSEYLIPIEEFIGQPCADCSKCYTTVPNGI